MRTAGRKRINIFATLALFFHLVLAQGDTSYSNLTLTNSADMALGYRNSTATAGATTHTTPPPAYVYRPPQAPLDVERYPVAPASLELEQVHVYVRHGERTPVGVRLSAAPASIPEHWMMCKAARQFRTAVSGAIETVVDSQSNQERFLQTRKVVERSDGTHKEGECLLGELTDVGRQSTYNLGRSLRSLYINKLGFLPDSLNQSGDVYFRSTNMPRTIESLQQVIHGLYPTSKCNADAIPYLFVRNGKDENLLGNTYSCKRLEILQVGFAQAAASAFNPTLEPLDKKLSKYLGGNPIRVDGRPRASGILDTIRAATAHGVKVPPEFEDKATIDVIETAVVNEWFAGYKTEEVRRLGMGRLLDDLVNKMQRKADNASGENPKILLHSTHDTAIAALCSTLDVYDEKWPAFTAAITFELYKAAPNASPQSYAQTLLAPLRAAPSPEYYIRMRYQNKNMVLPLCADEGKHLPGSPEFCTFRAFQERVKELTPVDWDAECAPAGRLS